METRITVAGIEIAWDPERGICRFESLPVAMMWVDTTLSGLMSGVQAMVGTERFRLALQSEGRKSVEVDWRVISRFADFSEGFKAIATIAAVAGWGDWHLVSLDGIKRQCCFRVQDSWESRYQKALGVCWGSAMVAGKFAGYCSNLFGANCWAEQTCFSAQGDPYDEFLVSPSERLVEDEIEKLLYTDHATRADMAVALQKLRKEIADRQETELRLRESEQRFRALIQNSSDVITLLGPDGAVLYDSPGITQLGGYTPDERSGCNAFAWIHPDDQDWVRKEFGRLFENPHNNITREFRFRHKDGSWRWVEMVGSNMLDVPGVNAMVANYRDVTERKRAEERHRILEDQLIQAQKMESIGRLAGGVAHDFNNMLTPIIGYAELVRNTLPLDDPQRFKVDQIIQSGERCADLIRRILAFARKQNLEMRPLDLNQVITGFENILRRILREDVSIQTHLVPSLGAIQGDMGQIEQVLLNLAINAQDAMPRGVTLLLETAEIFLDDADTRQYAGVAPGPHIMMAVSDTGIGIDKETLSRLFEPFFTTKAPGAGTGLGLATVDGIVNQHGGHIRVYSEPGEGATFRIYFPKVEEPVPGVGNRCHPDRFKWEDIV